MKILRKQETKQNGDIQIQKKCMQSSPGKPQIEEKTRKQGKPPENLKQSEIKDDYCHIFTSPSWRFRTFCSDYGRAG